MTGERDLATEHEDLLQFLYLAPVGIVRFRADGSVALMNPKAAQLLLPIMGERATASFTAFLADWAPDLRARLLAHTEATGQIADQVRVNAGIGAAETVLAVSIDRVAADSYMATLQDVTDAARLEYQVHSDRQRFRAIFDNIHDYSIYMLDRDGNITEWNQSLYRLGGWEPDDVVGRSAAVLFPAGALPPDGLASMLADAVHGGSIETEGERVRKDGSTYWGNAVITVLPDRDGTPTGFVVVSRDISERRKRETELLRLATTDALTGVSNRRYAATRLEEAFERFRRYGSRAAVLMIDIDHFKRVNDRYGHVAGDVVLKEVARRMRDCLRNVDVLARWGGEEFMALLPETGEAAAVIAAGRIRDAIRATPIQAGAHSIAVTVSLGVSGIRSGDAQAEVALKRADMALYAAKTGGRDRVEIAAP